MQKQIQLQSSKRSLKSHENLTLKFVVASQVKLMCSTGLGCACFCIANSYFKINKNVFQTQAHRLESLLLNDSMCSQICKELSYLQRHSNILTKYKGNLGTRRNRNSI